MRVYKSPLQSSSNFDLWPISHALVFIHRSVLFMLLLHVNNMIKEKKKKQELWGHNNLDYYAGLSIFSYTLTLEQASLNECGRH